MSELSINDLPRFSPWPARLLGLEPWTPKEKTPSELVREFEHETWRPLLTEARQSPSLAAIDARVFKDAPVMLVSIGETLQQLTPRVARERYLDLVEEVLRPFLPASALVELGAGYGNVILHLAQRFAGTPVMAGEYTTSGVEICRLLAAHENIDLIVAPCDLSAPNVTQLPVPTGAVLFTSYAAHYNREISAQLVDSLSAYRPKMVVHFEPCFEHAPQSTLVGLMRRSYILANGYNVNLATVLHQQRDAGKIEIVDEQPALFGANPLLPASVIAWRPR
jgi:hypothetical protein